MKNNKILKRETLKTQKEIVNKSRNPRLICHIGFKPSMSESHLLLPDPIRDADEDGVIDGDSNENS